MRWIGGRGPHVRRAPSGSTPAEGAAWSGDGLARAGEAGSAPTTARSPRASTLSATAARPADAPRSCVSRRRSVGQRIGPATGSASGLGCQDDADHQASERTVMRTRASTPRGLVGKKAPPSAPTRRVDMRGRAPSWPGGLRREPDRPPLTVLPAPAPTPDVLRIGYEFWRDGSASWWHSCVTSVTHAPWRHLRVDARTADNASCRAATVGGRARPPAAAAGSPGGAAQAAGPVPGAAARAAGPSTQALAAGLDETIVVTGAVDARRCPTA